MSIFTAIPNNKFRSRCSICNSEVSKALEHRHQQYHILGELALSPTESACPLCNTPVSIKAHNFVSHMEKFHKLPHQQALFYNNQAKTEAENRKPMEKPTYQPPNKKQSVAEVLGFEETKSAPPPNEVQAPVQPKRNLKKVPFLPNENEIDRERRLNREYVKKFRAKVRAERGLPAPKQYDRSKIEGETREERDRRKNNERVKAFRARQKQAKEQKEQ